MSKLQELARSRNSAKGRIKRLRNNMRGILTEDTSHLTKEEIRILHKCEAELDVIFKTWDEKWEDIKSKV